MTTIAAPPSGAASTKTRRKVGNAVWGVVAWIAGIIFVFPVIWMILTSLKQAKDVTTNPPVWFFTPTFEHFTNVFDSNITPFLLNSLMASVFSTLLVVVLATPAAYALSLRPVAKWSDALFFFISTKMMPVVAAVLPVYLLTVKIGMKDNIWTMVILYTSMNLPLAIWMMRSFLLEVPREVLEAGEVDGAGLLTSIRRIILPIVSPGLAATALICFIFTWNEFFLAVNLTDTNASTAPIFLLGFISGRGPFLADLSAAAVLLSLPVLIAGWVAQNKLVRGLSMGAVK
ncbi:carbohydrate ABC transporter permease [Actinoplanes friuliensis]|jgi:sorbitol/mannitol transport system permease protein|uniref:Sugar ABC transporter permease n=1 Tax=Actinoplanes friuliensis DSM 7358 TaxID=1246995 RepID=U5VPY3_9ACTN|nr:carbohydrate ABC transporter permease [Actinoplanes friuliensis]AGZ38864.1 sugar ABC transporter permease [Actinoplanes friuliensis DSM 7358]